MTPSLWKSLASLPWFAVCSAVAVTAACAHEGHGHAQPAKTQTAATPAGGGQGRAAAVAVLHAASGSAVHGTAKFTETATGVAVVVEVSGLTPNQQHAIHVHEFGDCTAADAASAGSHYNPDGHPHALPTAATRHAGDLGNLQADARGNARLELVVTNCSIDGDKNPILGRAVIVHAKHDDGGQPVGNAGGRIACGVIGIANPAAAAGK
jgi:Cu-Zn family superoxide dismutase